MEQPLRSQSNRVVGIALAWGLGVVLLSIGLSAGAQSIELDRTVTIDIRAQPLPEALIEFSKQSGLQIVSVGATVRDLATIGVHGKMTVGAALSQLLKGTKLSFRSSGSNTIGVFASDEKQSATEHIGTDGLLAANGAGADGGRVQQDSTVATAADTVQATGPTHTSKGTALTPNGDVLDNITVTGSRIITTAGEQVLPVRTYTREDIQEAGQSSVAEFLNTRPSVSVASVKFTSPNGGGVADVQLHGLPLGSTLTLLNGHRTEADNNGTFDLNNIPSGVVERIEILPVGASAVYGSNALAGAVNIITRKSIEGFEVNEKVTRTSVNSMDSSFSLAWGHGWDRASLMVIGTLEHTGNGNFGNTPYAKSLDAFPGVPNAFAVDACSPGTAFSLDGNPLSGLTNSRAGALPGITGKPSLSQFSDGAVNRCILGYQDFVPPNRREGIMVAGTYQLTDRAELYTEILGSQAHEWDHVLWDVFRSDGSYNQIYGPGNTYSILAKDNPYNPFGQDVGVSFAYNNIFPYQYHTYDSFLRPLFGIRGGFLKDWHYDVSAYASRSNSHWSVPWIDQTNPNCPGCNPDDHSLNDYVAQALASSDPAIAINPFSAIIGTPAAVAALASHVHPSDVGSTDNSVTDVFGNVTGSLFTLPAGAVKASIGAEYTKIKLGYSHVDFDPNTGTLANNVSDFSRDGYSFFGETRVPLVGTAANSPGGGDRLALSLAARYDHTSDFGGKPTYQGGLRWKVTPSFSVNTSYGTSYRAPRLNEIEGRVTRSSPQPNLGLTDPFRGDMPVLGEVLLSGPNPNLKPETGNSVTFGFEYDSQAAKGLRVSAVWYDLKMKNYIAAQDLQTLINYPGNFPNDVTRGPLTPADQALGYTKGPIEVIQSGPTNYGDIEVAGVDLGASYSVRTASGIWTPSVEISTIYRWTTALSPALPNTSSLGEFYNGGVGFSPRLKGNAALNWQKGTLSAGLTGRYFSRLHDFQGYVPNDHYIEGAWLFDGHVQYEVGKALRAERSFLAHFQVGLTVVNLLNKQAPFTYYYGIPEFTQYDWRGRIVQLRVGTKW